MEKTETNAQRVWINLSMLAKRLKHVRCDKQSTPQWLKEGSATNNVTQATYHKPFFSLAWHSSSAARRVVQISKETETSS